MSFDEFIGGGSHDPFASMEKVNKIHIRMQQRNGKKCITTVSNLEDDLDLPRICKALKKLFECGGSVETDRLGHEVIQLQGDHRIRIKEWLIKQEIVVKSEADRIIIHGA